MASKRDYLLQKGLQLKALNESVEVKTPPTSGTGKNAREVAKIRETCPPGTEDSVIVSILAQTKGDPTKVSAAVSELWEDNRGHAQDEWATVEKKGKKKTEQPSSRREGGNRSGSRSTNTQKQVVVEEETPEGGGERSSGERGGRGSTRGRGAPASRGGRGGAGGRGRGSGRGSAPRNGARTTTEGGGESDENAEEQLKGDKAAKKGGESKSKPSQVAVAPQPEVLNLTGAWTKKPTFLSAAKPVQTPVPAPTKPAPKPVEKPAPVPSSPVRKAAPAPSTPVTPLSPVATAVTSPKLLSPQHATASLSPKKVASPAPAVSKVSEKVLSPKKIDSPKPAISGWGSLDVSTTSMGDWSTASTEKKTVPVTNAWARGSPLIASTDKPSPLAPSANPASPKEIRNEVASAGSNATSPKYLKLGRWDTGATTNMALQFGSFSLNNEQLDTKSPRGWASTTTSAPKAATTSETPNAWGTQTASPKKAASSPKRTVENDAHGKATVGNNGPPGLSVESGRTTPKAALSPRSFAPSAPSPASLPKPDDVKRNTPTRAQGSFQNQTQSQPQSGSSKIGSGSSYGADYNAKTANLYQPTYGQYAMGMSGPASTQSQIANSSNTPKGPAPRSSGPTSASISSPTNSAQQAQQQFHAQQAQAQQPKPSQQQTQQVQQHQQQQQQQGHSQGPQQNPSQHHQQHAGPPGYHPHYAPPPPPGMAMAYNPYNNYANYYQGYGYYPNPQYAQYSPRAQYPPRGNVPYGVEGPMPGFPNPASVPVGYQDQHLAHQHEYAGAVPQGFGEISGAGYLQQPSHHHPHQQGPQSHGKGSSQVSSQPRSGGMQGYQSTGGAGARDQSTAGSTTSGNPSAGANAGYGQQQQQHYGWSGSYGGQPMGGWGHMGPQAYQQQNPSHQHPASHQPQQQQSYRQYSGNQAQSGNSSNETGSGSGGHGWSS